MDETHAVDEVRVGYHPDGYRIDKSAEPLSRYTRWTVEADGVWTEMKPVCFHSLPETGWIMGARSK